MTNSDRSEAAITEEWNSRIYYRCSMQRSLYHIKTTSSETYWLKSSHITKGLRYRNFR